MLDTKHGKIHTPIFIPVGTLGTVKTLTPLDLKDAGAQVLLGNTYHLMQQPGVDIVEQGGGLAEFMSWNGPTVTDSGGFQVYSLSAIRKLDENGVNFRSVYNGDTIRFTPENVYELQRRIGADLIYALDECPPFPSTKKDVASAVELTTRWAKRFFRSWESNSAGDHNHQRVMLVVQGGIFEDLRQQSCAELSEIEPFGFAIGGLSVGEPQENMIKTTASTCAQLPEEKPRHLMGVGTPSDMIRAIECGVDLFDCVMPTRNGRNGQAFTSHGKINIRNLKYRQDQSALDENCNCYCCRTFSRSYLNHLTLSGEILGMRMISLHNITYYLDLINSARQAISDDVYSTWRQGIESGWEDDT